MPREYDIKWDEDKYNIKWDTTPGSSPDNPIQKRHPNIPIRTRVLLKWLTANSDQAARYLKSQGFEVKDFGDYNISVRKSGEREWRVLDPKHFEIWDIADIGGDIFTTTGMIAGGAGGGLLGGPKGAVLGSAALGGTAKAQLVGLGGLLGFKPKLGEAAEAAGTEAALGAAGELTFQAGKPVVKAIGGKIVKPIARGIGKLLKTPAALEEAASGQMARERMRVTGQDIAEQIKSRGLEQQAVRQQLTSKKAALREAKDEATIIYDKIRAAGQPAIAKEAEARFTLKSALLNAEKEANIKITEVLAKQGLDFEEQILSTINKAIPKTSEEIATKGLGDIAGKSPWEVFRKALDTDVLHPVYIHSVVLEKWPAFTKMMEEVFNVPFTKFIGLQGISQELRKQIFWQRFLADLAKKDGLEMFIVRTQEYQRRAAKLLLQEKAKELSQQSKTALFRIARGVAKEEDKIILANELMDVAMKLQKGNPEVRAAQAMLKEAQVGAAGAHAERARGMEAKLPRVTEIAEEKLAAEKAARPKLETLQKEIGKLERQRVEEVLKPRKEYPSRRYPYFGRQAVETALKSIAAPGHALEWLAGGPTPKAIQYILIEMKRGTPRLYKLLINTRKAIKGATPVTQRALIYAALQDPEFQKAFKRMVGVE